MLFNRSAFKGILLTLACAGAMQSSTTHAQGLFNNPAAVLDGFCDYSANRRTLVYLDQSIIATTDEDWFRDIRDKLDFLPAERVSFRMIDGNSRVTEIWSTCNPSLSPTDLEAARAQDNAFRRGIDRKIQDAQGAFSEFRDSALAYTLQGNPLQHRPTYTAGEFPRKSIVEALYYDSSAYRLEGMTTRVVLFSDMVEHSELAAPGQLLDTETSYELARAAADRYPVSFNNAEFYVHGIGYTHNERALDRNLRDFWEMWLNKSGGQLASFDRQLNLADTGRYIEPVSYRGSLVQDNGTRVAARMRLTVTESGYLTNSWLGIRDLRYPLQGEQVCVEDSCSYRAVITFADEQDMYLKAGDVLTLDGDGNTLQGAVGSEDDLVLTPDGKRFSLPATFERDELLVY